MLAFAISFALFVGPELAPLIVSRQVAVGMFPAGASQQNLFIASNYVYQVPVGVQVPMSLELSLLYRNYTTHAISSLQIGVGSPTVSAGSNVSFSITVPSTINETMYSESALHVFLIDPSGLVAATWPTGDALYQPQFPSHVLQFKAQSGSYYQRAGYSLLQQGTLRLTYTIQNVASSAGVWKVLAFFVAPATGGYPTSMIPTAVGSGTFVVPATGGLPSILEEIAGTVPFFTTLLFLFGLARKPLPPYIVNLAKTYWPLVAAVALVAFYLYIQFVVL